MYVLLLLVMLTSSILLVRSGVFHQRRRRMAAGGALLVGTVLFFALLTFWGEMLWFESLGFERRFWVAVGSKVGLGVAGAAVAVAGVMALTAMAPASKTVRYLASGIAALLGGSWIASHWRTTLLFLGGADTATLEPIHGRDVGFYLFTLPFLDAVYWLVLLISGTALALALFASLASPASELEAVVAFSERKERGRAHGLFLPLAAFLLVLAWGQYLDLFHLLYSDWGVVAGPGWTDVHVRIPALVGVAVLTGALGVIVCIPALRRRIVFLSPRRGDRGLGVLVTVSCIGIAAWAGGLLVVPALVQWLLVEPNEITFEKPYIAHNIEFTQKGFRLDRVEEREFPAEETFTRETVRENKALLSEVRLWDWRALDSVFQQFQEIRLYYEFFDVDIDRYVIGDRYRQVMISAREMNVGNLPPQSQTFVNQRFKYTHGYGIALTTVSDFTEQGLPEMLVKDIPPKSAAPGLEVTRPELYYGELASAPAVVNSEEAEFDFPRGDENAFVHYAGSGGIELENLWRKFVLGWKFDGTRFLLSTYPTPSTRFMMRRTPRERVAAVAPFLELDEDPYIVLADGRLHWIVDAYTTSRYFPYSEPFSTSDLSRQGNVSNRVLLGSEAVRLNGVNFVRNSVKAVVDAYDGAVTLYVFDSEDPIIAAWQRVFPKLFRERDEMPESLRSHVRYPADFLLAQGIVYAKYHMTDPEVFYNQEDLWVRATEKYYTGVQPVRPYYVMWEMPSSDEAEFVLMQPFTPKNRQVLIGWIAGMSDGENYGRFLAYKFPKEKRILGPQQVETKIDQDRFLSGQLTLWDQRGSNVIRGNVLAIPIEDTLLYVEPIYLRAETAAYPELRLVVVMHGDRISYAESFDKALGGLFAEDPGALDTTSTTTGWRELAERAQRAFDDYLGALGEGEFEEAADALERLRESLRELARASDT